MTWDSVASIDSNFKLGLMSEVVYLWNLSASYSYPVVVHNPHCACNNYYTVLYCTSACTRTHYNKSIKADTKMNKNENHYSELCLNPAQLRSNFDLWFAITNPHKLFKLHLPCLQNITSFWNFVSQKNRG